LANTNKFLGLARGPIDHQSSSVINVISNDAISMGSAIKLVDITSLAPAELLPRATEITGIGDVTYGIAVGGDVDGIYGDGSAATDDSTRATSGAGEGVVVVTQGRCLARVGGFDQGGAGANISIGNALAASSTEDGVLVQASSSSGIIIARPLQTVTSGDTDIIAVDIQREGLLT